MIRKGLWVLPAGAVVCLLLTLTRCDAPDPTGPASSARIVLTATDTELPADGSSISLITAYVKNPQGNPASGPIYWSTSCGILDKSTETMTDGISQVTITAPNYPCTAEIVADAVHAKKSISILFYSVDAYHIEITANPWQIPADGSSTSTVSASVTDERGLSVQDGTVVYFTTTGGFLSAETATTSSGKVSVSLRSETVPKDARVTASVGTVSEYCTVRFYSTGVGRIELQANPSSGIPSDGVSGSILTASVYDRSGNPVEDGNTVYFATTWGSLSASSATTYKGVATVILRSLYNTYSDNTALVTAVSGDISDEVEVEFNRYQGSPPPATSTPLPSTFTPTPTTTPQFTTTAAPSRTPTASPVFSPSPTPSMSVTFTPTPQPTYTAVPI